MGVFAGIMEGLASEVAEQKTVLIDESRHGPLVLTHPFGKGRLPR